MSYGALNSADIRVLEKVLAAACSAPPQPVRVLEIGVHSGSTARGMKEFIEARGFAIEYCGVDNGVLTEIKQPFPGAEIVLGDSAEVFHLVPGGFDVLIVDGAHSRNHVILDTYNYSPKVRPGGFILFHDTSPEIQQTMREAYGPDIPEFYNSVNDALAMIRFPWRGWSFFASEYEPGHKYGGMTAFRREYA